MSLHKSLGIVVLLEAIANVILSIALVRPLGIVGDALGTAIPLLCTSILFLPRHLCRRLEVPLRTFLWEVYFFPLVFCVPMALALAVMQHFFYTHRYPQLVLNLTVGICAYGIGTVWLILDSRADGYRLRRKMLGYLAQVRG